MASVTFYTYDTSDITKATALADVTVFIFTADGSAFLDSGTTDSDGEVVFELPDSTYWVRFFKAGFSFDKRLSVEITEDGTYDVGGDNLDEQPPATQANLCRVSGFVVGAAGQRLPDVTVEFMLTDYARITAGMATGNAKIIAVSDEDGYYEFDLIRGARYEVVVESYGEQVFVIAVPDAPSTGFTRLIWPYVARVDLDTESLSLIVGDIEEVGFTTVLSSGWVGKYPIGDPETATPTHVIYAKSSDTSVATVDLQDTVLKITAVGAGSCEIVFTPKLTAGRRTPEALPTLTPLQVVVNE
jgi:hypothetical protein